MILFIFFFIHDIDFLKRKVVYFEARRRLNWHSKLNFSRLIAAKVIWDLSFERIRKKISDIDYFRFLNQLICKNSFELKRLLLRFTLYKIPRMSKNIFENHRLRIDEQRSINGKRGKIIIEPIWNSKLALFIFSTPPSCSFLPSFLKNRVSSLFLFHQCLGMVHKSAILLSVLPRCFTPFASTVSLFTRVLAPVFLSGSLLYIVITIFIPPPYPSSLFLPSEFIKVSGVFSRN